MATQIEPPTLVSPRGYPSFELCTFEDAKIWAEKELKAWEAFRQSGLPNPLARWAEELVQPLLEMIQASSQAINDNQHSKIVQECRGRTNAKTNLYTNGPLIASLSPDGQRLLHRFASGDRFGAILEAYVIVNKRTLNAKITHEANSETTIEARGLIESFARSVFWDAVDEERIKAAASSHDAILSEFSYRLDKRLEKFEAANHDMAESRQKLEDNITKIHDDHLKLRNTIAVSLRRARRDFHTIRQTYESFMALGSPADYWKRRATGTKVAAVGAFVSFTILGAAIVALAVRSAGPAKEWITGADGRIDAGAAIVLSPFVILVLWLFRMITRIFTVNVSEAMEAGQRKTMVTTFLALIHDPNTKLSDAERFLILQALFRPSGSKEDSEGVPSNMIEAMVKAAQGKS